MRTRVLAVAASMALIGSLVAFTTTAGAVTKAEVRAKLLTIADMPTGWTSGTSGSSSGVTAQGCLKGFKEPPKGAIRVTSSFEDGTFPALQEVIETGKGSLLRYRSALSLLTRCESHPFSLKVQGHTIKGKVGAMSFPKIGDQSKTFAIVLTEQGVSIQFDFVYFKIGPYEASVGLADYGTPDITQFQSLVHKALTTIQGSSVNA